MVFMVVIVVNVNWADRIDGEPRGLNVSSARSLKVSLSFHTII